MGDSKEGKILLRRAQSKLEDRVVRGYRSISFQAALPMALMIILDLLAKVESRVYHLEDAIKNGVYTVLDLEIECDSRQDFLGTHITVDTGSVSTKRSARDGSP